MNRSLVPSRVTTIADQPLSHAFPDASSSVLAQSQDHGVASAFTSSATWNWQVVLDLLALIPVETRLQELLSTGVYHAGNNSSSTFTRCHAVHRLHNGRDVDDHLDQPLVLATEYHRGSVAAGKSSTADLPRVAAVRRGPGGDRTVARSNWAGSQKRRHPHRRGSGGCRRSNGNSSGGPDSRTHSTNSAGCRPAGCCRPAPSSRCTTALGSPHDDRPHVSAEFPTAETWATRTSGPITERFSGPIWRRRPGRVWSAWRPWPGPVPSAERPRRIPPHRRC